MFVVPFGFGCHWPPLAKRIVVLGGPYQYYAVHQYSVVRRVWGPGGLPVFLNFGASRPPRNRMDVILTTPVRCIEGRICDACSPRLHDCTIGVILFHVDKGAVMPTPRRLRAGPSLWLSVTAMTVYK